MDNSLENDEKLLNLKKKSCKDDFTIVISFDQTKGFPTI